MTPVLAAVGAVVVNTTLAALLVGPLGLPGIALADRDRRLARGGRSSSCCSAAGEGPLGSRPLAVGRGPDVHRGGAPPRPSRVVVHALVGPALAPDPAVVGRAGHPRARRGHRDRRRGVRRDVRRRRRSPCGSTNCALSSRSWSTRSAARAGRDGDRADRDAWDAFVEARDPGSYLQLGAWARVKAVNGWAAHRLVTGDGRSAPRSSSAGRGPLPWGFAYAPRGPVGGGRGRPRRSAPSREPLRDRPAGARRPRLATCASIPRSRSTDRSTPTARSAARCGPPGGGRRRRSSRPRRGSSTSRADEAALWGDLRKKWRQYVNKARSAGVVVVDAEGDRLGEFYRIYRETADRAGFLIRTEAGVPRRLGGLPAGRPRPPPVRADRRRRAARDAVPRPLRAAGRGAVRRHDPGRRRQPGELPAQVGGDPLVARAGRRRATTCGASRPVASPTSRPGSAAARSATSGRGTSCSIRSGGRCTRAAAGARAWWARRRGRHWAGPAAAALGVRGRGGVTDGRPREATTAELADWDRADGRTRRAATSTSRGPGRPNGHASAGGRSTSPLDDDHRALVLMRPFPSVGRPQRVRPARAGRRPGRSRRRRRAAAARLVAPGRLARGPGRRRRRRRRGGPGRRRRLRARRCGPAGFGRSRRSSPRVTG